MRKNAINLGIFRFGVDYETPRLCEEADKLGIQVHIYDRDKLTITNASDTFKVFHKSDLISGLTHVIFRNGNSSLNIHNLGFQRELLMKWFSANNTKVLNGNCVLNSTNASKLWESMLFIKNNVPTVESYAFGNVEQIPNNFFIHPKVAKQIHGSVGKQVWKITTSKQAVQLSSEVGIGTLLFQPFYPGGVDYRVIVIGATCLGAVERTARAGDFRTNARGAVTKKTTLTEEMMQLSISAAKAMGFEYAGVDLIPTQEGLRVLEVNKTAKFKVFEANTKANVAKHIISYLCKQ